MIVFADMHADGVVAQGRHQVDGCHIIEPAGHQPFARRIIRATDNGETGQFRQAFNSPLTKSALDASGLV